MWSQTLLAATAPPSQLLDWSYRWGADPGADRTAAPWTRTDTPANPPGRGQSQVLWLKLDLPPNRWRDPALFINSVDLSVQVFDAHGLLYQYGRFDDQGRSRFAGWPWHLIAIPDSDFGQPLYFRVFSDYTDIGLSGEIALGARADLLQQVYWRGFTGMAFALAVLLIGLVSMSLGFIKRNKGVALATGFLSFDLALMMFAENELSQVVYDAPYAWRLVAAYSYFLLPALLAWVLKEWFKAQRSWSARLVMTVSGLYVVLSMLLSLRNDFNLANAYPPFDWLFALMSLLLLLDNVKHVRKADMEGRLVLTGMLIVCVSMLVDMASAHGIIDWIGHTGQWGLSLFALSSLAVYLVRDWRQQQQLHQLQHELEETVVERTRELTLSQQQLLKLAHEDPLTGLLNRRAFMAEATELVATSIRHALPLSLVLFDVDHFKLVNDRHGHAVGDEVLKAVANAVRRHSRDGDLLCRYGGEEFVILLPGVGEEESQGYLNRLRSELRQLAVQGRHGELLHVNVSMGVVVMPCAENIAHDVGEMLDQILSQADAAMYEVKRTGRDGVVLRQGLWATETSAWNAASQSRRVG